MSLDTYRTTQPADEQNTLACDEPEGCADCGDLVCSCDERCPTCKRKPHVSDVDFAGMGECIECRMDRAAGFHRDAQPSHLHADTCPPRPAVLVDLDGSFVPFCGRHEWEGPAVRGVAAAAEGLADAAMFTCPSCLAEWQETRCPDRDGFARYRRRMNGVRHGR